MSYTTNIPAANDDPSVSQGEIQGNFNEINTWVNVNHTGFGGNEGKHNFVEMPRQTVIPAGLLVNEGTLYTKTPSTVTNLYYTPDNSGNEYQLTRTISASTTTFGTNTNYQVGPPSLNGGWTFLPGGLLMQYGSFSGSFTPNTGTITFPVTFTTGVYSLNLTLFSGVANTSTRSLWIVGTPGTSGFDWKLDQVSSAGNFDGFFWTAIGN